MYSDFHFFERNCQAWESAFSNNSTLEVESFVDSAADSTTTGTFKPFSSVFSQIEEAQRWKQKQKLTPSNLSVCPCVSVQAGYLSQAAAAAGYTAAANAAARAYGAAAAAQPAVAYATVPARWAFLLDFSSTHDPAAQSLPNLSPTSTQPFPDTIWTLTWSQPEFEPCPLSCIWRRRWPMCSVLLKQLRRRSVPGTQHNSGPSTSRLRCRQLGCRAAVRQQTGEYSF